MKIKNSTFNAEQRPLALQIVRTLVGAIFWSILWFILGWALSSFQFGLAMAVWTLFLGPLLLPPIFWLLSLRGEASLKRLRVSEDPALAHEFFRGILYQPGPNPSIWFRSTNGISFVWFESVTTLKSRQKLIVSSRWLKSEKAQKIKDWQIIWSQISAMSLAQRKLRSIQMALWVGALSPLAALFFVSSYLFSLAGFEDLPRLEFFALRLAWDLKNLWFATSRDANWAPPLTTVSNPTFPDVLNSLLWGVWHQIPAREMHPAWLVLTHRDSVLESI